MKKALKIGAGIVAINYAFNLFYAMGLATPIANELIKGNYRVANAMSNLNRKNYKEHKWIAELIDDTAKIMVNTMLIITKDERRVEYTTKN